MADERAARICVCDGKLRAASWKCWSPPEKNDIYLACRELNGAMKVSLHETGQWHFAYDWQFYEKSIKDEHKTEKRRFIEKWTVPTAANGVVLAFRIVTPSEAMCTPDSRLDGIHRVPNAPPGRAIEFDIFILESETRVSGWPGKRSMNTALVGSYALPDGRSVWIVSREIAMPPLPKQTGKGRFYEGKGPADLEGGNLKVMAFGREPDGSRTFYDLPVSYVKSGAPPTP